MHRREGIRHQPRAKGLKQGRQRVLINLVNHSGKRRRPIQVLLEVQERSLAVSRVVDA